MSRLVEQIKQAVTAFVGCKTTPALIGGLALAAHQVVRATRDVDFLADADDADRLHEILLTLGYRCVWSSYSTSASASAVSQVAHQKTGFRPR